MSEPVPPIAFDDVVLDLAGRRLLRSGIDQPLEPKAFAVLALLAGSPGRVFTRDEILDAVWSHRHVTPGVLNRIISLLRHALGEQANAPRYLHTLHGVGYRFDPPEPASAATTAATPTPGLGLGAIRAPVGAPPPMRRAHDVRGAPARWELWVLPILVLVALAGWNWWPRAAPASITVPVASAPAPKSTMERSIAVLPLANASNDKEQQFFSDGLSDNLINALSRFDELKVIGRTSAFQFRDSKDDSATIGRRLGVAYLLNGSVQRGGDVVRINASLTKVADGSTLWAEHYDRPYKDLFALQDEIAQAIASALHAKLLSAEDGSGQSERPPSGNMAAYDAYLRGMQSFYRGDMRKVVEHQELAIRLDPGYAAAWAQLGIARTFLAESDRRGSAPASENFAKARTAVDTALQLSPDLGMAHGALGNLLFTDGIDWNGALAELRRATSFAPNSGQSRGGLSRVLAAYGKLEEAIEQRNRFLSIEPLFATNYSLHSQLMIAAGRLDEAEKDLRIAQELEPSPHPSYRLMYIAIIRGDASAALQVAGQQRPPWRAMNLAVAAQLGPDRSAADAVLARVIADGTWKETSPYPIAQAYALRDDANSTLAWLERTWAIRDTSIHQVLYDPLILRFRDDPRLIAFCKKIGLPAPSTSEALSIDQIRANLARRR